MVSDITLKKRAEEEMKKSTDELIKLNETKDRFLSIISHDLRTPFSSILGFTDLLANDEELTNEERKQYVKYIQESSKSMLSLVNSLLDWTRLQTGRIPFEPERIDPSSLIEKSIHSVSGDALSKRIEIYSTVKKGKYIFVDKSLINQVFNNLLSNSIKFTKDNGRITISVRPASTLSFLEFSVRDNGQGIKEDGHVPDSVRDLLHDPFLDLRLPLEERPVPDGIDGHDFAGAFFESRFLEPGREGRGQLLIVSEDLGSRIVGVGVDGRIQGMNGSRRDHRAKTDRFHVRQPDQATHPYHAGCPYRVPKNKPLDGLWC